MTPAKGQPGQPALTADNITLQLGSNAILRDLSCCLPSGAVTALLGPNGSGKTSLLRTLSGELHPQSGQVRWDNRPLPSIPHQEWARNRAMLAQFSLLNFAFTVEEIVLMGRTPHRRCSDLNTDRNIAAATIAKLDLEAIRQRPYTTLSGGEKQRVHLARVLTQVWPTSDPPEPSVLLLDEPTAALDLQHQHQVFALLRQLARQGYAIGVALHDLNLALQYADSVLILQKGKTVAAGPTSAILTPQRVQEIFQVQSEMLEGRGSKVFLFGSTSP